ncbi:hypothetical protein TNIN_415591 [Trichonephila inaurata madagascariensis]|uniref:Uncharacterized protein n=1 Tax=Trichonephila inaurata madagascariensis TaxID=2747483 RepID=A0A8X7C6C9_9ARAC|nr:hypothetical protein TNIN_415591 [Trichonephila inaurata madagascariensis]
MFEKEYRRKRHFTGRVIGNRIRKEHESRHPSVMAFSGPHRYWDSYARVLGKDSEKKEDRKKQEHWKRQKSNERSRVNSKRNEVNERKKQTDTQRRISRQKKPRWGGMKPKRKENYNKKSNSPPPSPQSL